MIATVNIQHCTAAGRPVLLATPTEPHRAADIAQVLAATHPGQAVAVKVGNAWTLADTPSRSTALLALALALKSNPLAEKFALPVSTVEFGDVVLTYVPEISYARIEGDVASEMDITEGEVALEAVSEETVNLPFPSLEAFRELVAETLDELPQFFFKELSGGVIVQPGSGPSEHQGLLTMGQYRVGLIGRQVVIYYGSFATRYSSLNYDELLAQVRGTVRHEFRHHLESLSGMHGVDTLEAEDRRQLKEFLNR